MLVVRTLLDIPLGPISITVAVGPYQKWTEIDRGRHRLIFMFKETVEVALPSLASNVEMREESNLQFVFKYATCSWLLDLCFA